MKINNKLLDEKITREKSAMKLYLASNYTYTNKNAVKLTLSKNTSKGDNLSLYDGGVKIGKGVTHVLVTGQIYFFTGSNHADGKCIYFYKNSTLISRTHCRTNLNYIHVNGSTIIPVSEGDVIYLYAQNDIASNQTVLAGGVDATHLNVIEI